MCPNDGRIELGLEDITAVVFRGPESVEVVFQCPHCGVSIRAALRVPNMLLAAMEIAQYGEEAGDQASREIDGHTSGSGELPGQSREERERRARREREGESYCEYFRRQLERVECVEDMLAELD